MSLLSSLSLSPHLSTLSLSRPLSCSYFLVPASPAPRRRNVETRAQSGPTPTLAYRRPFNSPSFPFPHSLFLSSPLILFLPPCIPISLPRPPPLHFVVGPFLFAPSPPVHLPSRLSSIIFQFCYGSFTDSKHRSEYSWRSTSISSCMFLPFALCAQFCRSSRRWSSRGAGVILRIPTANRIFVS